MAHEALRLSTPQNTRIHLIVALVFAGALCLGMVATVGVGAAAAQPPLTFGVSLTPDVGAGVSVLGSKWTPSATVTIAVDDPGTVRSPDFVTTVVADANGNFGTKTSFSISVGDVVTVTDGVTTKSHTVRAIKVTKIDPDADTVSGTVGPGSSVWVAVNSQLGWIERHVTANGAGAWSADFSTPAGPEPLQQPWDIVPGDNGAASVGDADGDYTFIYWFARQATTLARTSSAATISYGSRYSFTGTLKSGSTALVGERIVLQRSTNGVTFSATSLSTTTKDGGAFSFSVKPTVKTWYRARFAATSFYFGSTSSAAAVSVKAWVGTPVAPATMSRTRSYTVYGFLKPRHAAGSFPVRIYKARRVSGTWKSYGYVLARASNYSSYSKYAAAIKLPYAGTWRLGANHADRGHAASRSSGYEYVTVK